MTGSLARVLIGAAVLVTAAGSALPAGAQDDPRAVHLLDVPYLPQSEALCGGAAVAMVMRYWGAIGVYAETFAGLVDQQAGGIRGADLLRDLHGRGWTATSFRGDAPLVRQHLAAGRPVIALIEDRPGRFHYVVLVGWDTGRVVLHDPARAPFRIVDEGTFTERWKASDFWTLLALKPANDDPPGAPSASAATTEAAAGPCGALIDEGVRLAETGSRDEARKAFELAASTCPQSAAPWRELAGLHALGSNWREAAADARQALARQRNDEQAARILATALFLEGDSRGALRAWNAIGEPRIDIVNVQGLERTRFAVAATAVGAEPGDLLTPETLDRAERRLGELPAAQVARMRYTPAAEGHASLDAAVIERPLAPTAISSLAVLGTRALTDREAVVTIASPSGGGEAWHASWRWWERRPRLALGFDAPAPFGGTWGVALLRERQAYATGPAVVDERVRAATFHIADWTPTALRWQASAAVEDWQHRGRSVRGGIGLDQRLFGDRVSLRAAGSLSSSTASAWAGSLQSDWRSTMARDGGVWLARGGVSLAGAEAPLGLWPGAGTGQGRDLLLRAHPLLHDGVIDGAVFGRRVVDAGVEWRWWRPIKRGLLRVAPAVFADAARAVKGLEGSDTRAHLDAGAGLRVAVPGSGVLRFDLARGLRDGGWVFSAGWTR